MLMINCLDLRGQQLKKGAIGRSSGSARARLWPNYEIQYARFSVSFGEKAVSALAV